MRPLLVVLCFPLVMVNANTKEAVFMHSLNIAGSLTNTSKIPERTINLKDSSITSKKDIFTASPIPSQYPSMAPSSVPTSTSALLQLSVASYSDELKTIFHEKYPSTESSNISDGSVTTSARADIDNDSGLMTKTITKKSFIVYSHSPSLTQVKPFNWSISLRRASSTSSTSDDSSEERGHQEQTVETILYCESPRMNDSHTDSNINSSFSPSTSPSPSTSTSTNTSEILSAINDSISIHTVLDESSPLSTSTSSTSSYTIKQPQRTYPTNKSIRRIMRKTSNLDLPYTSSISDPIQQLLSKNPKKLVRCNISNYPNCELFICGTVHVAKSSVDLVLEAVRTIKPEYIVLELCEERIESLYESIEETHPVTLGQVVRSAWRDRSLKTLGMGLLVWLQLKAAKILGNKLGGELAMAAKEGAKIGSILVLGDRNYHVTIQRVYDRLSTFEKLKLLGIFIWEALTMSWMPRISDYLKKTENDENFMADEMKRFSKSLPSFYDVIVSERDEYITQSILQTARIGFSPRYVQSSSSSLSASPLLSPVTSGGGGYYLDPIDDLHMKEGAELCVPSGRMLVVCGMGHMAGIQKLLSMGGSSPQRMGVISSSSKHLSPTWPVDGSVPILDTKQMFPQFIRGDPTPAS